eukprot:Awhi_evm1s4334
MSAENKIEEVPSSDDEMPELEEVQEVAGESVDTDSLGVAPTQSRNEKKARKALSKMGLKPVAGINRITMRKKPSYLLVVEKPDVYKSPSSDTYVFFGECKTQDMSQQARQRNQYAQQQMAAAQAEATSSAAVEEEEEEEEGDIDETGLDAKEIELVMAQASASRAKAVKALRNHDGDMVNAIMELSEN